MKVFSDNCLKFPILAGCFLAKKSEKNQGQTLTIDR